MCEFQLLYKFQYSYVVLSINYFSTVENVSKRIDKNLSAEVKKNTAINLISSLLQKIFIRCPFTWPTRAQSLELWKIDWFAKCSPKERVRNPENNVDESKLGRAQSKRIYHQIHVPLKKPAYIPPVPLKRPQIRAVVNNNLIYPANYSPNSG